MGREVADFLGIAHSNRSSVMKFSSEPARTSRIFSIRLRDVFRTKRKVIELPSREPALDGNEPMREVRQDSSLKREELTREA